MKLWHVIVVKDVEVLRDIKAVAGKVISLIIILLHAVVSACKFIISPFKKQIVMSHIEIHLMDGRFFLLRKDKIVSVSEVPTPEGFKDKYDYDRDWVTQITTDDVDPEDGKAQGMVIRNPYSLMRKKLAR